MPAPSRRTFKLRWSAAADPSRSSSPSPSGNENLLLLDTEIFGGPFPRDQRLAFGAFKLAGTNPGRELGATWDWSVEAAKP